jgi:hypothetical protein
VPNGRKILVLNAQLDVFSMLKLFAHSSMETAEIGINLELAQVATTATASSTELVLLISLQLPQIRMLILFVPNGKNQFVLPVLNVLSIIMVFARQ